MTVDNLIRVAHTRARGYRGPGIFQNLGKYNKSNVFRIYRGLGIHLDLGKYSGGCGSGAQEPIPKGTTNARLTEEALRTNIR